jgi:IS30 family transposase
MALSYTDIARALNKSPYTVKNQMRQMRLKADLFDRTVGDQSRNRFKLKDGLRIEKYLNVS